MMYAVLNLDNVVGGFSETGDPIADVLRVVPIEGDLPAIGDIGLENDGVWSFAPAEAPPLSEIKAALKAAIDAGAEAERLKYITGGAGQAMEYQQAAAEASSFLAAAHPTDPPAGTYPMLEASVGIDGDTLADVATVVATMFAQWQVVGSAIRAARLAAKQAIDLAETIEDARAVTVAWPSVPA